MNRCRLGKNLHLGYGNDKLSTPLADKSILFHDFVLEVPGQDKQIIRFGFLDLVRMADRNVCAGRILSLLVGIAIDSVVEEVLADAAIIEKRIALARRTITGNRFPRALRGNQKFK